MTNEEFERELERLNLRKTRHETTHMRRWDHESSGAGIWIVKGETATSRIRQSYLTSIRRRLLKA